MINHYFRLVKFSHTLFSLPFAVAGFFLAPAISEKPWQLLVWVLLAVVFARNAAMAFNRYTDRYFDKANPRTAMREIPSGMVKPNRALLFVIINSLLLMFVSWMINPLCFALSPVALVVILGYSLTKRITPLSHLILGVGLALAPLGAWLAVTAAFHPLPVMLALAVLCWVAGFDIIYALQDEQFDRRAGLYSIPCGLRNKESSCYLLIPSLAFLYFSYRRFIHGRVFCDRLDRHRYFRSIASLSASYRLIQPYPQY